MLEYQRLGRNKDTIVNSSYINGGEYRRKFDNITKSDKINRILYSKAKEMLFHRSGTLYEDMYWFDGDTGDIVAKALDELEEKKIEYTPSISKAINGRNNLITMHTHPNSMPPSIADFNSCFKHNYGQSLVICHNGTVYSYSSNQKIPEKLYDIYIKKFGINGNTDKETEKDAQLKTLLQISRNYSINFKEVK